MAGEKRSSLSARVHGRVQGVGFRMQARSKAERLGIVGWVKNEFDGTVRVEAEGPTERIQRFREWLEQGPPGSRVTQVDADTGPDSGRFDRFSIR